MIISNEVRNAIVNAAAALVNSGSMLFREGSTTLLTFALKAQAFGGAAAGSANMDVTSPTMSAEATADAVDELDNYQIRTSGAAVRFSGSVGGIGSGAEIEVSHPDVVEGDQIIINVYTLTQPDGS